MNARNELAGWTEVAPGVYTAPIGTPLPVSTSEVFTFSMAEVQKLGKYALPEEWADADPNAYTIAPLPDPFWAINPGRTRRNAFGPSRRVK